YATFRGACRAEDLSIPDFDALKAQNWMKLPILPDQDEPSFLTRFRDNPSTHRLATPSGRIEIFSQTVGGFGYPDCAGHPIWLPPSEWLGQATPDAPLHLVSPQPGDKLHSQLESALADVEGARPEALVIHPKDAADRGISSGDLVRVHNARGACLAKALVSDSILESVVALPTGAWYGDPSENTDPNGNPNVLTLDVGTSRLGQGCSAHTALVDVTKVE
ncbi:MAG: molybdopterin dinucleotide binding domain-containing protein, partial [Pseudomonadota bacterium]